MHLIRLDTVSLDEGEAGVGTGGESRDAHRLSLVRRLGSGTMSTLPQRTFGTSGLAVSILGLGCNNLGRTNAPSSSFEGSLAVVDAALEAGITFFDVADNYGAHPGLSEEFLGRALGARRADVVVATKFGMDTRDP